MRQSTRTSFLVCLLATLLGSTAYGQVDEHYTYNLVLRGVPMGQALEELARLTEINLVYTSALVSEKQVFCAATDASAETLLQCLLAGSGLDYVRSSAGTYVLIEALEEPSFYGDLAGSIVDLDTGEPLPFANVLLADASTGTTSNEAGLFSFSSVLAGLHRVVVTYVGYETTVDSIWVAGGNRQRLQIALRPESVPMPTIVIDGLAQRLPSTTLGMGALSGRQLVGYYTAGTPDVARGAGSLPGVAVHQPLADLYIQGGDSGEHLTLLDGVAVRDPVSLGRHLSAFSPLAINRLSVHKAGFGAEHGSHLSGVIAVEQDVAGAGRPGVMVSADPVSFNAKAQGQIGFPGGWRGAAMVAVRSSLWDVYRDPGIESLLRHWNVVDPVLASRWLGEDVNTGTLGAQQYQPSVAFSDLHAAVRVHMSPFRTLHASVYRARNGIASDLSVVNASAASEQDRLILTSDDYDWSNWAAQVRHDWIMGARSIASMQVRGSWHASQYSYRSLQDQVAPGADPQGLAQSIEALRTSLGTARGSYEHNEIRELSAHATLTHSFATRHHVEASLLAAHTDSQFRLGNQFIAAFWHEATAWEFAGYVKETLTLGLQTTVEPGLRLTYLPHRSTVYAEPRLAVRYDRAASRIGPYALRIAGGLYRQYTNQFELSSSGSTSVVPSIRF